MQPDRHADDSTQFYASAARKAGEAVRALCAHVPRLQCIVHLGDIIDGQPTEAASAADLDRVIASFESAVRFLSSKLKPRMRTMPGTECAVCRRCQCITS